MPSLAELDLAKAAAAVVVATLERAYNEARARASNPAAWRASTEARAMHRRIDSARLLLTHFESL